MDRPSCSTPVLRARVCSAAECLEVRALALPSFCRRQPTDSRLFLRVNSSWRLRCALGSRRRRSGIVVAVTCAEDRLALAVVGRHVALPPERARRTQRRPQDRDPRRDRWAGESDLGQQRAGRVQGVARDESACFGAECCGGDHSFLAKIVDLLARLDALRALIPRWRWACNTERVKESTARTSQGTIKENGKVVVVTLVDEEYI